MPTGKKFKLIELMAARKLVKVRIQCPHGVQYLHKIAVFNCLCAVHIFMHREKHFLKGRIYLSVE